MARPIVLAASVLWLAIVVLAAGCGTEGRSLPPPMPTVVPPDVVEQILQTVDLELGAKVYAENCTACHGLSGHGDGESVKSGSIPNVPDFHDPSARTAHTPEAIFAVVSDGRMEKFMPPWSSYLSEAERWAVALYVYSFTDRSFIEVRESGSAGS
ncbi:MAG: cytochrome c [Anaerolineae bacterium]|nr:cytochrome c [Anaerolineae bacterium]